VGGASATRRSVTVIVWGYVSIDSKLVCFCIVSRVIQKL